MATAGLLHLVPPVLLLAGVVLGSVVDIRDRKLVEPRPIGRPSCRSLGGRCYRANRLPVGYTCKPNKGEPWCRGPKLQCCYPDLDCSAQKQIDNCVNVTGFNKLSPRRECCSGDLVLKNMDSGCNCCGQCKLSNTSTCTFKGGICVTRYDPVYNFDYCINEYNGTLHHEECEGENCACCIAPTCYKGPLKGKKVYIDDIENALSFALRNTITYYWCSTKKIPVPRVFNPNSRAALNAFFKIILEYLKPSQYIHQHTYGIIDKTYNKIKQTSVKNVYTSAYLTNELIYVQNNPKNNQKMFISPEFQPPARCCKPDYLNKSSNVFWLYTCGLWNILHTITHEVKAQQAKLPTQVIYTPIQVIDVIYNYVIHFQGCPYCENHFSETYDQTLAKYTDKERDAFTYDDAILWLWCTHNAVNHRYTLTYGGESKSNPGVYDPPKAWPPHPQFPSDCKDCWSATPKQGTTNCKKLFCKNTYDFWFGKCFQTPDDYSQFVYHNFFQGTVLNYLKGVYSGPYLSLHTHTWKPLTTSNFGTGHLKQ